MKKIEKIKNEKGEVIAEIYPRELAEWTKIKDGITGEIENIKKSIEISKRQILFNQEVLKKVVIPRIAKLNKQGKQGGSTDDGKGNVRKR